MTRRRSAISQVRRGRTAVYLAGLAAWLAVGATAAAAPPGPAAAAAAPPAAPAPAATPAPPAPPLLAPPAAIPPRDAKEEAKSEFKLGNVEYNLGRYPEAIGHFEKAYSLSRLPEILFNLGQCYRKRWELEKASELGRRALHYYEALVREAPSSRVRADADQFIAELGPAISLAEAQERQGRIDAARGVEALRLAQGFFRAGQLQDAAAAADRLLASPDNGRDILVEAYLVRGRAAAGLGDLLGAAAHFRRALELRPAAELVEPKGPEVQAFEAARQTATGGGLRLVQPPLGEVPADHPARIDVTIEGDSEHMVAELELGYRRGDAGAFRTARVRPPAALVVPASAVAPAARIDYYVRALDAHGGVLAESGTPALPFRLQVAGAAPGAGGKSGAGAVAGGGKPWYGRWWVWAIVGAVVAGGGAAAYAGTRGDDLTTYKAMTNQ